MVKLSLETNHSYSYNMGKARINIDFSTQIIIESLVIVVVSRHIHVHLFYETRVIVPNLVCKNQGGHQTGSISFFSSIFQISLKIPILSFVVSPVLEGKRQSCSE